MNKRLLVAGGVLGVGFILVLIRLLYLTVLQGEDLAQQATLQHRQRLTLTPRRGAILDRNGEPLALSVPAESLFVRSRKLPTDFSPHTGTLAAALHLTTQEVGRTLRASAPFVWLKRQASLEEATRVRALGISGIDSVEEDRRFYPQGSLAAPVLGFINVDARGLEGVERQYDSYLRGEPAEILEERDAHGRTILTTSGERSPEALNVYLTLDASLQYVAERELEKTVRETRALGGTAVILDPETFAVLALAQVPTFNPNAPADTPAAARRNPTLSNCYEPGSTMKTLLAAAALDTRRVRPDEQVFCELGHYQVGNHTIHDHHSYGTLTFTEVIQHSSNIGAAKIGERLGKESYYQYLSNFGLGRKTGIDLPSESPGLLPPVKDWSRINLVTASFGQGVAVTPLQLACAYAALANNGVLQRPYIVREVRDTDGNLIRANTPQSIRQVVRPETARQVLDILERVVEREGTGWRARIEGVRIAGKTGTSQKINGFGGYSARGRIASFVGIVPADQPRLVILIAIDEPKTAVYGGEVAAPVFQVIARHALAQLGIEGNKARRDWATMSLSPPDGKRTPGQPTPIRQTVELTSQEAVGSVPLTAEPNFLGLSLRSVLRKAQHEGQRVVTTGSGYVARQTLQNDPVTGEQIYALTLTPTGIGEARP